jgi:hypothetical protein
VPVCSTELSLGATLKFVHAELPQERLEAGVTKILGHNILSKRLLIVYLEVVSTW